MKIAVYSIALNEAKHVERWAESAKDADYLVLFDTGSTDETVEVARRCGIIVEQEKPEIFRFNEARNRALDMIPEDVDFCVSLDMDEVLHDGWRRLLEEDIANSPHADQFHYLFINSRLEDGSPGQTWVRPLIHRRKGFRWKWPVHEIVQMEGAGQASTRVVAEHFPDKEKPREYLPMLQQAVKDLPDDARMAFYCGREYFYFDRKEEAAVELKRYLTLEGTWAYEISEAMSILSKCEPDRAEYWLLRACSETPDRREPWVELGDLYFLEQRWQPALGAYDRALSMPSQNPAYIRDDKAWNYHPFNCAAVSAYSMGAYELAIQYGEAAAELWPEQEGLTNNLNHYREAMVEYADRFSSVK